MNGSHRVHFIGSVALCLLSLLGGSLSVSGCGGSEPMGGSDMGSPSPNPSDMATNPALSWPGTWIASLGYNVTCTIAGTNPQRANQNQTNSLVIEDNGSGGLAAYTDGNPNVYVLMGTGSSSRLLLSGRYPVKDMLGNVAGAAVADQNNITLTLDTVVDKNKVTGTVSGTFKGRQGHSCTIDSGGQATLQR